MLLIAAGKRPRARRAPTVREGELSLHFAVVDLLQKLGRRDWAWAHYPSGEARDPRVGAKLKRMGAKAGWPDLQLVSPTGIFYGLELKAPSGRLSEEQEAFRAWATRCGVSYSVAWKLDEAIKILVGWGAIAKIGGAR